FRGRHYDVREAKRLMKKVDKELEEDRQFFEGLDRRAFLVYYQMAMQADADLRKEFFKRYDFHLTCQDMLRKLNVERNHMQATPPPCPEPRRHPHLAGRHLPEGEGFPGPAAARGGGPGGAGRAQAGPSRAGGAAEARGGARHSGGSAAGRPASRTRGGGEAGG